MNAGAGYMFLCRKRKNASLLDAPRPWPVYLICAAVNPGTNSAPAA
jgi:uncharacterized membrane protein YwaF